jgi:phosphate transport system substrate-binding protein
MKGNPAMRLIRTLLVIWLGLATALFWTGGSASAAPAHTLIEGSGSSWAANAINQWIADVHARGLQVSFSSSGSGQGRSDFANKTVDFAVSDIGFQGVDPTTQASDTNAGRAYAYLPIVAGGTALPYHIVQNGQLVQNLRLSPTTIAKIFAQQIKNWDDPEITADNNGKALPDLAIIPVQHSEASGSSYQFTRFMAKTEPSIWKSGAREYFPDASGAAVAQNGSDAMINFIGSGAANGAIGYDEYSYALGAGLPVVKVLNSAGYYTLPSQYNVAVALTKAQINMNTSSPDYLLQNLDAVYGYGDDRTYPLSSYSYAIIPTAANDSRLTTAKRQTLADYLDYSVCQGQSEMGKVGYSPLPVNLVQASFNQIAKLHTADKKVDISTLTPANCNNPTFIPSQPDVNCLAKIAPPPPPCDKQGAGPCTGQGDTGQYNPNRTNGTCTLPPTRSTGGSTSSGSHGGGTATSGSGGGGLGTPTGRTTSGGSATGAGAGATTGTGQTGGTGTTGTSGTGGAAGGGASGGGAAPTAHIDPLTGQPDGTTTGSGNGTTTTAYANTATLPAARSDNTDLTLGIVAGGLLLGALIAPAVVSTRLARKDAP